MSAALSWTDNCQADLDGAIAAASTGTTLLAIDPAYPAANALDPDPSLVSRWDFKRNATPAAPIYLSAQWSASNDRVCRVLAALNVRLPSNVEYCNAIVTTAGGTLLGSGSAYLASELVPIAGTTDRYDLFWLLSADVSAAMARLVVQVPASTDGSIEVGRFWCGPALVLATTDAGWGSAASDPSEIERGRGGALIAERLPVLDDLEWPLSVLSYEQAYGTPSDPAAPSIRQMRAQAGLGSPIVAIQRSDSSHSRQVLSAYAALIELPDIRHQSADYYATRIRARQIR